MEEKHLMLDLYFENEAYGIYLCDNHGGSGITVTGHTPEEAAENIKQYIIDYFYEHDE